MTISQRRGFGERHPTMWLLGTIAAVAVPAGILCLLLPCYALGILLCAAAAWLAFISYSAGICWGHPDATPEVRSHVFHIFLAVAIIGPMCERPWETLRSGGWAALRAEAALMATFAVGFVGFLLAFFWLGRFVSRRSRGPLPE